jgi:leucyl-tRNA synthetase
MMDAKYDFRTIEEKWQKRWAAADLFRVEIDHTRPKYYYLDMFAYPSGDMHMGHVRNYTIGDVVCRKKVMQGHNVLHPTGFDAFGLPAEEAAIDRGLHPRVWTTQCMDNMLTQYKMLGLSFDYSRLVRTCDPDYYKWTQWVFVKLFEKGLAIRKSSPLNWCPSCQTVLANEQVIQGECERCHSQVTKKSMEQWFFRNTQYAQRMLDDMAPLEGKWPDAVLALERNWIGRSEGAEIVFEIADPPPGVDPRMPVFTTRPDTVFGVTYMVIAPEHPLVERLAKGTEYEGRVREFVEAQRMRSELDRTSVEIEKEGIFTGAYAINPANDEKIPIWVADYVLLEYGTGVVMAVPAHDTRDYAFAVRYGLPIRTVIRPPDRGADYDVTQDGDAYIDPGIQMNSGPFDGIPSTEGIERITQYLADKGRGGPTVSYRYRDWCISRQRYWGAPIPMIKCERCDWVPVPEDQLPVLLPDDVEFTGRGGNPIAQSQAFVNTTCPKCGGPARRETDTMDTFVCSSWYYLRYPSANRSDVAWAAEDVDYWMPIDLYIGGIEHAQGHMLFSCFITKAFYDMGLLPFDCFATRHFNHGVVTLEKRRMSKRGKHLVAPVAMIEKYGADAVRGYILFIAPAAMAADWNPDGIEGIFRWLSRVYRFCAAHIDKYDRNWRTSGPGDPAGAAREIRRKTHQTVRKVSEDIERLAFNTAISAMMEFTNALYAYAPVDGNGAPDAWALSEAMWHFALVMSPFAPHLADELWERMGEPKTTFESEWPSWDEAIACEEKITIPVSVNGKRRDEICVAADAGEATLKELALASARVKAHTDGKEIKKIIIVPGRMINIVV